MAVPLLLRPLKQGTRTTVKNPQRKAFPGIYRDPRIIVAEAAQRVPPENPLMFDLFGVTRGDLDQMAFAKRGTDQGVLEVAQPTKRSTGALASQNVMTKANEQRMIDLLEEARREAKFTGSAGWYESEPLLLEFMYELGPDEGKAAFDRFTQMGAALSPAASVPKEIKRSSLAYMMDRQGRLPDFYNAKVPGLEFPGGDYGHIYHTTTHADKLKMLEETGSFLSPDLSKQPKTRDYVQARFGNTTAFAGDAHDARRYGLADTRTRKNFDDSMEDAEKRPLRPFHSKISDAVDLDETPAQALGWNVGGTSTGVESPLGVPFLELFSESVGKAAAQRGEKPAETLGSFIRGEKPLLGAGGAAVIAGGSDDAEAGFLKRGIDAGNDVVKGDIVEFKQDVFGGSYKRPTYLGQRTVHGEVLRESYGADKQQHTFTIKPLNVEGVNADELLKKDSFRIKGRNLYKNGVLREMSDDEAARKLIADEKHERGAAAREARDIRKGMAGVGGAAIVTGSDDADAGALSAATRAAIRPQSSVSRFWDTFQETIGGTRGLADTLLMGAAVVPSPIQIPALAIESGLLARDLVNYINSQERIDPRERQGALMMSP